MSVLPHIAALSLDGQSFKFYFVVKAHLKQLKIFFTKRPYAKNVIFFAKKKKKKNVFVWSLFIIIIIIIIIIFKLFFFF